MLGGPAVDLALAAVQEGLQAFQQAGLEQAEDRLHLYHGLTLSPLSGVRGLRFEQALLQAATERRQADEAQMESDYLALKPLEQAVLRRLLEMG